MESGINYLGDNKFLLAVKFTFPHEFRLGDPNGGYTNIPGDSGGETKWGIAKKDHPDVDIKNLTLEQATQIYYTQYWVGGACLGMYPTSLACCHFDSCVNNGIEQATKWLEGSGFDWDAYTTMRRKFCYALAAAHPEDAKFLPGWVNRVNDLRKYCQIQDQDFPNGD